MSRLNPSLGSRHKELSEALVAERPNHGVECNP
jgi:hypothetical protein